MNSQGGRIELGYLLVDIIPIIISFGVGAFLLAVLLISEVVTANRCPWSCSNKRVRKLANVLILFMYGGNNGLQESSTGSKCHETSGFVKLYIKNREVPDNALLYFFLAAKSIVMITFIFSVFCDIFFITSFVDCDDKHECYILDEDYYDVPIENCSDVVANKTVCYAVTVGFVEAAGATGGLIAFSRFLLSFWSGVNIWFASRLVCHCKTLKTIIVVGLQVFFGIFFFYCWHCWNLFRL